MKNNVKDIQYIREQLVTYILKAIALFGLVPLSGSLSRIAFTGWRLEMFFHIGAYLLIIGLAVFRQRISYSFRAFMLMGMMIALAVVGLVTWGLAGTVILVLATLLVFTTLLWGFWAGTITGLGSILLVTVIGWGVSSGLIVFSFDAQAYHTSSSSWINAVTSCFLYFGVILGCTGYINNRLLALTEDYKKKYNDLVDVHKRMKESENRYRTLFDQARDAIFILREDRFVDCNSQVLEMFNCSREDILGTSPWAWSPEYQQNGMPSSDEAGKIISGAYNECNQMFDWQHCRKSGELFDVEVSITKVEVEDAPHLFAIVRDITDRKSAQRALQESEEILRKVVARQALILDSLPMAFYTAEVAGPYSRTWISEQVSRISGFADEHFIREKNLWRSRIHPDDYPSVMEAFDSLSTKHHLSVEYRWKHADGNYHWFQDHAVSVRDEDAGLREIIGTWLDIDDKKNAEKEREKLEGQLMQAQKMEVIGTLVGGIAHDFNNILFPMIGYLEMIIKALPEEDVLNRRISRVLEGARRAESLVRQILSVTRQTEEATRPLNVGTVVKEAVALSRSSLPASIEIYSDIDMDLGHVMATPTHIHQVVMNLVTNAFHAMQKTGGRLDISLKGFRVYDETARLMNLKAGEYVRLSVSDSGQGMTPDIVKRVFDPYFTTKSSGKGTGLGLFVVHGLVKKFNGIVEVESEPDMGTQFHVYLPVTGRSGKEQIQPAEEQPATAGNECILIVDDEEIILNMFREYLTEYGYKVITRIGSLSALELFQSQRGGDVDLMITDMVMPEMNGLALAEKVHTIYPDVPVILMTGYSEQITQEMLERADIRQTVLKPFSPARILPIIRTLLDKRSEAT